MNSLLRSTRLPTFSQQFFSKNLRKYSTNTKNTTNTTTATADKETEGPSKLFVFGIPFVLGLGAFLYFTQDDDPMAEANKLKAEMTAEELAAIQKR